VLTAALYALIMAASAAQYMADTIDYATSIKQALGGGSRMFWEFGHLWWRPLGYLTYRVAAPLIEPPTGSDPLSGIISILIAWNWLAGLVGALALNRLLSRLGARPWSVAAITLAYLITFGVLNYAHSGSSYIPGLACLLVALALLAGRETIAAGTAIAAGIALAGAVAFWAPYVLVIPAALAFPLVWFGPDRHRLRRVGLVTAWFVLVLGTSYLVAIQRLGIRDLAGLRSWVSESSHEIVNIRGVSRVAFGIPRSFLSMGKDGVLFKRFLLKDPYNPVSLGDLIRLSLVKVALVYAALLATLAGLLRGRAERRLLALAILGGLPVLGLAVMWQGGDVERYMPAYPLVFAAWALVLGGTRPSRLVQALVLSLIVVMGVVNLTALSRVASDQNRAQLQHRIEEIAPVVGPEDRILVVTNQDPLYQMKRDPLSTTGRDLRVGVLIALGHASAPKWRSDFAGNAEDAWARGGKVWISRRVLSRRPEAEWDWVEGDEKSVRWSDLPAFFEPFELGPTVGGDDGFAALAPTPHNEQLVRPLLALNPRQR
jgi:hypothetical protein